MTDATLDAVLCELRLLRYEVRLLSRCHPVADRRLGAFLQAAASFCGAGPWTVGELLNDARRGGRRDLLAAVDVIVGDATDPAKSLGRFLQRQVDVEVDGRRLVRIKREGNCWIYGVSGELNA